MKKTLLILVLVFCASTASMAVNELVNGGFETGDFTGWTATGDKEVNASGAWSITAWEGNYYAGKITSWGTASGEIVQWVDEAMFPGWDPDGVGKIITVTGATLLHSRHNDGTQMENNALVQIGVDWLDDLGNEQMYWFDPVGNIAYETLQWHPFEYQLVIEGYQPQFVSLHVKWWNVSAQEWSYMFVDGLSLEGECIPVPEPGSLMALGTGLMGLAGFAIRRRK